MEGAVGLRVAPGKIAKDGFFAHAHEMIAEKLGEVELAKA